MAGAAGLCVVLVSNTGAQTTVPSVDELSSTMHTLRPANLAVLRARRMAGRTDLAAEDREKLAELRKLIRKLELEHLDRGKIVVSQDLEKPSSRSPDDSSSTPNRQSKKPLRDWLKKNKMAPRRAEAGPRGRQHTSAMRRKALRDLLDDVETELNKPGRLGIARIRQLRERTKLKPGPSLEPTGDETPTISTIIKHRRDL